VTLREGTVRKVDNKGTARIEQVDPGPCKVTFPNMDQESWEKA